MINKILNYWIIALSVIAAGIITAVTIVYGWRVWREVYNIMIG